ncbi:SIMPL domain-containing protein [uncultured Roseibium sp.]|uniref:SIMPL domain-containing protein n=1 Tax=uncultured Roseibium sp. TaxID=1936171 RepID=UPI003217B849
MSQSIRLSRMPRRAPVRARVLSVLLLALSVGAIGLTPAAAAAEKPATISLQGRGEISVAPDMAVVTTRVVTVGASAPEALQANTAAIAKVIADIKAAGIEAKDIQTSGFSIYPRYEDRKVLNQLQSAEPKIVGYEVSNGCDGARSRPRQTRPHPDRGRRLRCQFGRRPQLYRQRHERETG